MNVGSSERGGGTDGSVEGAYPQAGEVCSVQALSFSSNASLSLEGQEEAIVLCAIAESKG